MINNANNLKEYVQNNEIIISEKAKKAKQAFYFDITIGKEKYWSIPLQCTTYLKVDVKNEGAKPRFSFSEEDKFAGKTIQTIEGKNVETIEIMDFWGAISLLEEKVSKAITERFGKKGDRNGFIQKQYKKIDENGGTEEYIPLDKPKGWVVFKQKLSRGEGKTYFVEKDRCACSNVVIMIPGKKTQILKYPLFSEIIKHCGNSKLEIRCEVSMRQLTKLSNGNLFYGLELAQNKTLYIKVVKREEEIDESIINDMIGDNKVIEEISIDVENEELNNF